MSGFHYTEFSKTGSILLNAEEKDELFGYIDRLKAENEQLRRERDFYFQQVTENGERADEAIDALNAENAKLRELVRHMHTCLEHYEPGDTISCEQCPYNNETWGCDYERLMAELGIEVDE